MITNLLITVITFVIAIFTHLHIKTGVKYFKNKKANLKKEEAKKEIVKSINAKQSQIDNLTDLEGVPSVQVKITKLKTEIENLRKEL